MSELQRVAIREAMRFLDGAHNGFREASMRRGASEDERISLGVEAGIIQSKARVWLEAALEEADDDE